MKITHSMSFALLAAGSLMIGCAEEPKPKTPFEVLAAESKGADKLPAGSASGRADRLKPGEPLGFWLGRVPNGDYFLRTTTKATEHRFQGRVRALNGDITSFRGTRMDLGDRFKFDGKDVVFDITTKADEDGFDFTISKDACVEINLRIDGKSTNEHIFVGEKEVKPSSNHFIVCPK